MVVNLDDKQQSDPNLANLSEAQLIMEFEIHVVVLVSSKVVDPVYKDKIASGAIALTQSLGAIKRHVSNIHWQNKNDVELKPFKESFVTLKRRLNLGDKIISGNKQPSLEQASLLDDNLPDTLC